MPLNNRKQIVLAKIESTYGTDSVPTGAANAILVSGLEIRPFEAETEQRGNIRPYLGNDGDIHVGARQGLKFLVELAGAGAAGTAPAYGPLLRACAFAETINAGIDVQYDPVSEGFESVTLYFNVDGQRHVLTGARGTVKLMMEVNKIPHLEFDFTGQWNDPASAALPTPDFSAFQIPANVGPAQTSGFSLHAWSGEPTKLELDLSNQVVNHETFVSQEIAITDRQPGGSLTAEAAALGTFNPFTIANANTFGALALTHGATTGNQVVVNAPNVQLIQPKYSELNNVTMIEMGLKLIPGNAGNDEFKLTVK